MLFVVGIFVSVFTCTHDNTSAPVAVVTESPTAPTETVRQALPAIPTPAPVPAPPQILKISPPALLVGYDNNEVKMQQRIGTKAVQIEGLLGSIEEDFSGSPVLQLFAGDVEDLSRSISIELEKSELAKAADLHKQQTVTVLCKSMKLIVGRPYGADCTLTKVKETANFLDAYAAVTTDYVNEVTTTSKARKPGEKADR